MMSKSKLKKIKEEVRKGGFHASYRVFTLLSCYFENGKRCQLGACIVTGQAGLRKIKFQGCGYATCSSHPAPQSLEAKKRSGGSDIVPGGGGGE